MRSFQTFKPRFAVVFNGNIVAATTDGEEAAMVVAGIGANDGEVVITAVEPDGAVLWSEGHEKQSASESFDFVAVTVERRLEDAKAARAKRVGHRTIFAALDQFGTAMFNVWSNDRKTVETWISDRKANGEAFPGEHVVELTVDALIDRLPEAFRSSAKVHLR